MRVLRAFAAFVLVTGAVYVTVVAGGLPHGVHLQPPAAYLGMLARDALPAATSAWHAVVPAVAGILLGLVAALLMRVLLSDRAWRLIALGVAAFAAVAGVAPALSPLARSLLPLDRLMAGVCAASFGVAALGAAGWPDRVAEVIHQVAVGVAWWACWRLEAGVADPQGLAGLARGGSGGFAGTSAFAAAALFAAMTFASLLAVRWLAGAVDAAHARMAAQADAAPASGVATRWPGDWTDLVQGPALGGGARSNSDEAAAEDGRTPVAMDHGIA